MPAGMPVGRGKMQPTMQEAEGISMIMQMQQAVMMHIFTIDATVLSKNAKQQLHFMQFKNAENYSILAMSHTEKIQYLRGASGAQASNEPYIQYRACKRKKLDKRNIISNTCSKRY